MGFSGNLSQLPNNSPDPANPAVNLPNGSGWLEDYVNPNTGARTFGFRSRAEHANRIGEILQSRGVKYFYHPEQDNYRFFNDPAHPELDTVHRIEWVMDNTAPHLFGWEIDILHNWSGRVRFLSATTHQPDISVWGLAQAAEAPGDGLAHQGRLPEHRADRDLGGRPAGERRRAVLPDVRAHARRSPTRSCRARATWARGPAPTHPNADPDCPGFKYMFENLGGQPAALPDRERQRTRTGDRPERRPRPLAAPREGLRRGAAQPEAVGRSEPPTGRQEGRSRSAPPSRGWIARRCARGRARVGPAARAGARRPDGPLPRDGLAAHVVLRAARPRGRAQAARRARRGRGARVPDQGRPLRERGGHGRRAGAARGHADLRHDRERRARGLRRAPGAGAHRDATPVRPGREAAARRHAHTRSRGRSRPSSRAASRSRRRPTATRSPARRWSPSGASRRPAATPCRSGSRRPSTTSRASSAAPRLATGTPRAGPG